LRIEQRLRTRTSKPVNINVSTKFPLSALATE